MINYMHFACKIQVCPKNINQKIGTIARPDLQSSKI